MNSLVAMILSVLLTLALLEYTNARPGLYRRHRHLTPITEFCNAPASGGKGKGGKGKGGTSAPKSPVAPTPPTAPTAPTSGKGKGGKGKGGSRTLEESRSSSSNVSPKLSATTTTTEATTTTRIVPTEVVMDAGGVRQLQTISLKTTLTAYGSYALPAGFTGSVVLTWPNLCFSADVVLTNFIPNCVGCKFVVTDGSHACSGITSVVDFVDFTEVSTDPYVAGTTFNTDATGAATVTVPVLCTGTGPLDNFERPFLLLDAAGNIAACGLLTYVCP